jgi:hypothetical protein
MGTGLKTLRLVLPERVLNKPKAPVAKAALF